MIYLLLFVLVIVCGSLSVVLWCVFTVAVVVAASTASTIFIASLFERSVIFVVFMFIFFLEIFLIFFLSLC